MRHSIIALWLWLAVPGCDKSETPAAAREAKATSAEAPAAKPMASVPRHPWGSFKPGSFAKLKSVTEMEIAGNKNKTEMQMNYTLLDLGADEAVVEMETVSAGFSNKTTTKFPLKASEGGKAADAPRPRTGTEEVQAAGKSFKCTWTEMETEQGGSKTVTKVWQCEDVPGFTVKSTTKTSGATSMQSSMELVEYAVK